MKWRVALFFVIKYGFGKTASATKLEINMLTVLFVRGHINPDRDTAISP